VLHMARQGAVFIDVKNLYKEYNNRAYFLDNDNNRIYVSIHS
jgi:hypothetical protein